MLRNIQASLKPLFQVSVDEAKQFIAWVKALKDKTRFEPEVMSHPRMCLATASDETGALLHLPFRTVIMFDCLAPKPGINKRTLAYCLWKIGELAEKAARQTGNLDMFATVSDDDEADSMIKHGWTEVRNTRLLRKRLSVTELPEVQAPTEELTCV